MATSGDDPNRPDQPPADPDAALIQAACAVSTNAYAPYSRFQVGAAVRSVTGAIYRGTNVENVAYPVGICAEAAALSAAHTAEGADFKLDAIAIWATSQGTPRPCAPCGACRQRLLECSPTARVLFFDGAERRLIRETPASLLPYGFSFEP